MKKLAFLIIILISFVTISQAQWEYNYFVIRAGLTNQFINPQPKESNGLYLNTLEGDYRLIPDTSVFFKYNLGFNVGLDFHFDLRNDMGGFIIGAGYMNYVFSNKFITPDKDYYLIRTMTMHSISFPIFIKFGYHIFQYQQYFFIGARVNWNFALDISEEVNWSSTIKTHTYYKGYFVPYNPVVMAGFNFLFFNIEADFMPESFLNKDLSINVGTAGDPYYIKPFANYPDQLFFITTSIYIPLSPWSSTRSYFLSKWLKLFK